MSVALVATAATVVALGIGAGTRAPWRRALRRHGRQLDKRLVPAELARHHADVAKRQRWVPGRHYGGRVHLVQYVEELRDRRA